MGDEKGIPLTPKQIERQLKKIKNQIFTNYKQDEDGSYQGEINPEILKIIEKYMKVESVEYLEYVLIIQACAREIYELLDKNLIGVDKRLLTLYTYDFVTQSMDAVYIIKKEEKNDDPMFM